MDLMSLSDEELEAALKRYVAAEKEDLANIIEHLVEFDGRRLALRKGFPSLFKYCTTILGYAESAAYKRINCVRAVERFPRILGFLREGKLHLDAVSILSPHLNNENHAELLEKAKEKTSLELETIVAPFRREGARRDSIRPVAVFGPKNLEQGGVSEIPFDTPAASSPEPQVRMRISFTAGKDCYERLERARQLLRHKFPFGELEAIFDQALEDLLDRRDPDRRSARQAAQERGARGSSMQSSRRIPQRVKDEVWQRDGGRCVFSGADGQRCGERSFLEYDHVIPYALGGRSDTPKNVRLLCRAHNQEASRRVFGEGGLSGRRPSALSG
jgi:5-methylcytosine-specific restriction endonuclease McrA